MNTQELGAALHAAGVATSSYGIEGVHTPRENNGMLALTCGGGQGPGENGA